MRDITPAAAGLRPGTTMWRIAELERLTKELAAGQATAQARVRALERDVAALTSRLAALEHDRDAVTTDA